MRGGITGAPGKFQRTARRHSAQKNIIECWTNRRETVPCLLFTLLRCFDRRIIVCDPSIRQYRYTVIIISSVSEELFAARAARGTEYGEAARGRSEPIRADDYGPPPIVARANLRSKMKFLVCLFVLVAVAAAFPQREGAAFTNEAIMQAQNTFLIPKDAEIQNVQEGIQLSAYESIPGNQRIDLYQILGDQVPREVINNLQGQIDQVGRN